MFAKRIIKPELLDHLPAEEARPNLDDLVRINTRLGGHSVVRKTLEQAIGERKQFTLLDVGAASGDAARVIQQSYPGARITCLDQRGVHIQEAPFPKLLANAFELPFGPGSFDYVICSLLLHHFTDEQVVELLASFYAAAKKGLFVFDLERHVLPYLFLPATRRLFRWHAVTVHDGRISVRAAFRAKELLALAQKAKISSADVRVHRPAFRLAMVAVK
jgi:2-polyprenyl-3-methyl-5-hydroxy-6-metoxy-1,4-benzoquinol methylase